MPLDELRTYLAFCINKAGHDGDLHFDPHHRRWTDDETPATPDTITEITE